MSEKEDSLKALFLFGPADFQVTFEAKSYPWKAKSLLDSWIGASKETVVALSPHFRGHVRSPAHPLLRTRLKMHSYGAFILLMELVMKARKVTNLNLSQVLRERWLEVRVNFFYNLFQKRGIQIVLGIDLAKPEILAAQRLGIPTVEIQHGVISAEFFRLAFPDFKPTIFAHWFKEDSGLIRSEGVRPLHIGLPPLPPIQEQHEGQANVVLVLLQYGFDNSVDGHGLCHPALGAHLDSEHLKNRNLLFRFHPMTSTGVQRRAKHRLAHRFPDSMFSFPAKENLSDAIFRSSEIVSYSSSSWVEATAMGRDCVLVSSEADRRASRLKRSSSSAEVSDTVATMPSGYTESSHLYEIIRATISRLGENE